MVLRTGAGHLLGRRHSSEDCFTMRESACAGRCGPPRAISRGRYRQGFSRSVLSCLVGGCTPPLAQTRWTSRRSLAQQKALPKYRQAREHFLIVLVAQKGRWAGGLGASTCFVSPPARGVCPPGPGRAIGPHAVKFFLVFSAFWRFDTLQSSARAQTHLDEAIGGRTHGVWVLGTSPYPPWTVCMALRNFIPLLVSIQGTLDGALRVCTVTVCTVSAQTPRCSLWPAAGGFQDAVCCIRLRCAHPAQRAVPVGLRARRP